MTVRHGGSILVDQLKIQGVERVFCIPGESFLAALDGLYQSGIEVVICRHEGGAVMMAEAYGKLTGKPGIAFVTRGPGATNASAGIHVAFQDSTPVIMFIGQVARDQRDREAFQEVNYRQMFAPLAKWVAEVEQTDRLPEYISHAFHLATSGRAGPVVLALPEDMLSASADVLDVAAATPVFNAPRESVSRDIAGMIGAAKRPMVIVGGGGWSAQAAADLATFAQNFALPVGVSFRCQDYMDNSHANYVGDVGIAINPKLATRVREADLLLVIGARLGEITTSGYSLLEVPKPAQKLIHIYPDASELGRVYHPDMAVVADSGPLLADLAALPVPLDMPWQGQVETARQEYNDWQVPCETPGAVKLEQIVQHLNAVLPDDAILTNGAGNHTVWLHRYYCYQSWRSQLAPTSGSMGYGLPAAVSAALEHPDRTVVCFTGDGCLQMTIQEFGTAVQHGANVIVIVANNGMYGTIRMHQEKHYPKRTSGTDLVNPDFAALARAYGGHGETVTETDQFSAAFARAKASGRPAIIELVMDPEALTPMATLSGS